MEHKIGEVFKYNGEWYQCVEDTTDDNCDNCCFQKSCNYPVCDCRSAIRSDGKTVAFKKLEKVGEPMEFARGSYFQRYLLAYSTAFYEGDTRLFFNAPTKTFVYIEIKQNKEDMEEKYSELTDIVHEYMDKDMTYKDFKEAINYWVDDYNKSNKVTDKFNPKPFNLEKAKAGKPVCTRDGRKARIICFDAKGDKPIIALIEYKYKIDERPCNYFANGRFYSNPNKNNDADLMMLPEKKEGWVNVYYDNDASSHRGCRFIYDTKEEAIKGAGASYIATIKISWEE